MINLLPNLVAIVILAAVALIRGRDQVVKKDKIAQRLRIAGLVPLGLQVAFFLLFAVGEMAGGDLSGAGHLLQAAAAGLPGYLAWLLPLEGGIVLLLIALISLVYFRTRASLFLIMAAPQLLSGILFLAAGWVGRRAGRGPGSDEG